MFTGGSISSLLEAGLDDGVKETAKEVGPLFLRDFAITILVKGGEEFVDFLLFDGWVGVLRKTKSLLSELVDLCSVNVTVLINVELVKSLNGLGDGFFTGLCDLTCV